MKSCWMPLAGKRSRRISVQKQGMLSESSKIQRTGEIPEGTDPGRSIRSPGKGDGSNCRKLKFSLISGWRPEHAKVSAVNFLWRILSARAKRSWLWYQRKPLKIQRRRSAVSASITKYRLYVACSSAELGSACGKEFRMSVAVEDEGLAAAAIRVLE